MNIRLMLAVFILATVGCAGMDKPNLNHIVPSSETEGQRTFSIDTESINKPVKVSAKEPVKESTSESIKKEPFDPVLALDAWMKKNMW